MKTDHNCQWDDRKPVKGTPYRGLEAEYMQCEKCGQYWCLYGFCDAAGDYDTDYKRMHSQPDSEILNA